ncbi:MAG: hypothetical protein KDA83_10610, partial [Planctomycetales bacterium]|nr:hypothetical protein [Planctomycetales bacterium]
MRTSGVLGAAAWLLGFLPSGILPGDSAWRTVAGGFTTQAFAQEAQWIWAPGPEKDDIDTGSCYFRRTFSLERPEQGEITIAADDHYELYLNGRRIGQGTASRRLDRYDISSLLDRGKNVLAVKVENVQGNTAALVARVRIKEQNGPWRSYSTNENWKTNLRPLPLWQTELYNDRRWNPAQEFGPLET